MSSVVRTSVRISPYSRICCFISAMLSTVFWKLSQTDTVQFTAVTPPFRMSSNTERLELRNVQTVDDDAVVVQSAHRLLQA